MGKKKRKEDRFTGQYRCHDCDGLMIVYFTSCDWVDKIVKCGWCGTWQECQAPVAKCARSQGGYDEIDA